MNEPPIVMKRMFGALLEAPFQAIVGAIEARLNAAGYSDLRPAHFAIFRHLPPDGARLTQMAKDAQMTKQSMGELVRHLEGHGYVQRVPDPTDRRAQIIRRTSRGWEVEHIAREAIRTLTDDWRQRIGPERFDQGVSFLIDLAELIESDHADRQ